MVKSKSSATSKSSGSFKSLGMNERSINTNKAQFIAYENGIINAEPSNGFETLMSISNSINFDYSLTEDEQKLLLEFIADKRHELNTPANRQIRQGAISKTISGKHDRDSEQRIKYEKYADKIREADTKRKLTFLSKKIEKDESVMDKHILLGAIRKKKRSIPKIKAKKSEYLEDKPNLRDSTYLKSKTYDKKRDGNLLTYREFSEDKLSPYIEKYGQNEAMKEIGKEWQEYKEKHGIT